jgi:hypothetical protein
VLKASYELQLLGDKNRLWLDGDDKVIDSTTTDVYHQEEEIKRKEMEDYNSQFVPNAKVHTYVITEDINTPRGARQGRRPPTLDLGAGVEEDHANDDGWRNQSDENEEVHRALPQPDRASAPSGHAK